MTGVNVHQVGSVGRGRRACDVTERNAIGNVEGQEDRFCCVEDDGWKFDWRGEGVGCR